MPQKSITPSTLFYGDNLDILCDHIADESIDLVYLDPLFISSGANSGSQIAAFEDTWQRNETAERVYHEAALLGHRCGQEQNRSIRLAGGRWLE
jgi:site-specific DNA-methyltransferase (adenine-specific)